MTWSYIAFWAAGGLAGLMAATLVLRGRGALTLSTFTALVIAWIMQAVGAKWQFRLEYLPVLTALWLSPRELFQPGMRLPLGLVTGAAAAGLWCVLLRAPWRDTGDALAVAASVLIAIGRFGCLANGCCMGRVCSRAWFFCMRFGRDTEAYGGQVQQGLIPRGAPLSLPAHPLPLYFAAASLVTLGVLLWLLRRGAPAGSMLAAFCILRPIAKLSLEPLRATPRVDAMMVGIPASVLVLTCPVLGFVFFRRGVIRRANHERLGGAEEVIT
jgi:prolipoprotein diacylglyceryltransferase